MQVLIAVSQINKDGDVRGGAELAHESDVLIEIEAFRWTVGKSRYQAPGASGAVFLSRLVPSPSEDSRVSA